MSDLLSYILADEPQFKKYLILSRYVEKSHKLTDHNPRSRLPSLYSDFRHLKTVNPDGYDANLSAWRAALAHAVRQGLISGPTGRHDLLNLYSGPELLRALETKEYGQPVALGTVIVGVLLALSSDLSSVADAVSPTIERGYRTERLHPSRAIRDLQPRTRLADLAPAEMDLLPASILMGRHNRRQASHRSPGCHVPRQGRLVATSPRSSQQLTPRRSVQSVC